MTLFLPICPFQYDVTWSAGSREQAQLLPICCEQPLLSTWVLQVTYHPSTFSKKYILVLSGILWQFISKVHLGTHLGTKPPITRPPLEQLATNHPNNIWFLGVFVILNREAHQVPGSFQPTITDKPLLGALGAHAIWRWRAIRELLCSHLFFGGFSFSTTPTTPSFCIKHHFVNVV